MSDHTSVQFAECALLPKWEKYKYDQMDCQGFVEAVLKDIGVRKENGKPYDWRGSNSMYRNYYSWRGTVNEAVRGSLLLKSPFVSVCSGRLHWL